MRIKKIISLLLVSMLSICLFFVFGFQIDVSGGVTGTGGSADVTLDPLKAAADQANEAAEAAELALEEALAELAAAQLAYDEAAAALEAALLAVQEAQASLDAAVQAGLGEGNMIYDQAVLALEIAQSDLAAAQLAYDEAAAALEAALLAVQEAQAALDAAVLAAKEADEAYTGYSGTYTVDEEKLAELQQAVEDAQKALDDALAAGNYTEEEIEALEEMLEEAADELDDAMEYLEEGESGEGKSEYFHIVTNSNNGGSFNIEGIYFGSSGEILSYDFTAEEGYELAWLRVGNTKIYPDELGKLYELSFDRKNLVLHAHFNKIKDYEPEDEIVTTNEEGSPDEGLDQDDEGKEKDNGRGQDEGKGKGKEKSNNGKKKDK